MRRVMGLPCSGRIEIHGKSNKTSSLSDKTINHKPHTILKPRASYIEDSHDIWADAHLLG
jgi:hypothetical protein